MSMLLSCVNCDIPANENPEQCENCGVLRPLERGDGGDGGGGGGGRKLTSITAYDHPQRGRIPDKLTKVLAKTGCVCMCG